MSANPEIFDRYDMFPIPAYCLCTCTCLSDQISQECAEDYDEYIPGACCPRLSTSSPYASICTLWVSPEISLSHNNEWASHKLRCTSLYNKLLYLLITQSIHVTEAGCNRGEIIIYSIRGQECTFHKDTYEQCPFKPLCLRCSKCVGFPLL